jgi:hypothetical protein
MFYVRWRGRWRGKLALIAVVVVSPSCSGESHPELCTNEAEDLLISPEHLEEVVSFVQLSVECLHVGTEPGIFPSEESQR